jgi:hypothetical protein
MSVPGVTPWNWSKCSASTSSNERREVLSRKRYRLADIIAKLRVKKKCWRLKELGVA